MSKKSSKGLRWSKKYVALICIQSCMLLFFGSIILIISFPTRSANAQPVDTTSITIDPTQLAATATAIAGLPDATATAAAQATATAIAGLPNLPATATAAVQATAAAQATATAIAGLPNLPATATAAAKATATAAARATAIAKATAVAKATATALAVPTNTPSPIITVAPVITPTAGIPNVIITPTANVVVPGGGNVPTPTAQPKNGQPIPTPPTKATPANPAATSTSTVAPIVPGDTAAPTNTTGGGGKTGHASLSSMLLPISGIVGMVGVAISALIGVEMRRRQRSLRRQQANAVAPYPNTGFSAPPQPPMQGINQQYSMQQYADMAGTVVMTPPPVSGMSPVANVYSTEMEVQAQFDGMPPAIRPSMMENEAAPSTSPPDWMQALSPSDDFAQNDQMPQDDIQTYMHPQSSAPNLNAFNGPTQVYNYPASPQNQGIAPTGGNFPGFQPGDNRTQSGMMEQIAEQATRANISTNSGPQSAKIPGNIPLITPSQPDPFLEAIMRQAQMGIFAMPDKDPGQQPS